MEKGGSLSDLGYEYDIYLSYAHEDSAWVDILYNRLNLEEIAGRKFKVLMDVYDFVPGESLLNSIEKGVSRAKKMICVLSPDFNGSDWTNLEYQMKNLDDPSGRRGLIIPIVYRKCEIPYSMRTRIWIDFSKKRSFEFSYKRLLRALGINIQPQNNLRSVQPFQSTSTVVGDYLSTDPDYIHEELRLNAFHLKRIPKTVYHARTQYRNRKELNEASGHKLGVDFILFKGEIWTFRNLTKIKAPLKKFVESEVEPISLTDFVDSEGRERIIELLNRSIEHHLKQNDLQFDRKRDRYYFMPGYNGKREVRWPALKKKAMRTVVRPHYSDGEVEYYKHYAASVKFRYISDEVFLIINPTRIRTTNGYKPVRRNRGKSDTAKVFNNAYWLDVMFWLYQLHSDKGFVVGRREYLIEMDDKPLTIGADFGIEGDKMDVFSDAYLERWAEDKSEIDADTNEEEE